MRHVGSWTILDCSSANRGEVKMSNCDIVLRLSSTPSGRICNLIISLQMLRETPSACWNACGKSSVNLLWNVYVICPSWRLWGGGEQRPNCFYVQILLMSSMWRTLFVGWPTNNRRRHLQPASRPQINKDRFSMNWRTVWYRFERAVSGTLRYFELLTVNFTSICSATQ